MPRIIIAKFGHIEERQVQSVLGVMNETYERLQPHDVQLVDVLFFENNSLLQSFLSSEKSRYGVTDNLDSDFPAIHDAWRGLPRVSFSIEKLNQLDDLVATGTIRHEVGHSVLHGSLKHYVFETPQALVTFQEKYQLGPEYTRTILYLIAIAVKDWEVTNLLHNHGYYDDQAAYVRTFLKPSSTDLISWNLARAHASARVLCVAGRLKDLLCATPILNPPMGRIKEEFEAGLSYFPEELSKKILDVMFQLSKEMKGSTHQKVGIATEILCKELFDRILSL